DVHMAGLVHDRLHKGGDGLLVERIELLGLYLLVGQLLESVLVMIGDKDRRAGLRERRGDGAADGACSVHHGRFAFADVFHVSPSFRCRWTMLMSAAFVGTAFGQSFPVALSVGRRR